MDTIIYKKRERLCRGKLNNFNDLPEKTRDEFSKIKKEILIENPNVRCYVMGSYFWGFWDDMSDLDVVVDNPIINLDKIKKKLPNIKFDILNINGFREIEIP